MKKSKVASTDSSLPRTPKDAMAPKQYEPTQEDKMRDGNYDLDHLLKSHEIQSDPEKMKYVGKAHEKRMGAMRSIADLKLAGQALAQQKKEELSEGEKDQKFNAKEEAGEQGEPAQPRSKIRYPKK